VASVDRSEKDEVAARAERKPAARRPGRDRERAHEPALAPELDPRVNGVVGRDAVDGDRERTVARDGEPGDVEGPFVARRESGVHGLRAQILAAVSQDARLQIVPGHRELALRRRRRGSGPDGRPGHARLAARKLLRALERVGGREHGEGKDGRADQPRRHR
jgi:hypothetical protein